MSVPEVRDLIARLVEVAGLIEATQAELYRLRAEQQRLRAELGVGATGHKPGERTQELSW